MSGYFEAWLGVHWGFIVLSYGAVLVLMLGVIAWVLLDVRAREAELRQLEARGVRRRSARGAARLQEGNEGPKA